MGLAAIKLDMSKAYDRVEWCFLEAKLCKLGFMREWIDLIMKCVRTYGTRLRSTESSLVNLVCREDL